MMKRVLAKLSATEPTPLPVLAKHLEMGEGNLRRALNDMEELGLVTKVDLPKPSARERSKLNHRPCMFGWKKSSICRL
jgi:DNA-binding MarR family transcriptional regulator